MKKYLLSFLVFGSAFASQLSAQVLNVGPDTNLCPGQSVTITATMINPGGGSVVAPTNVNFCGAGNTCDDYMSDSWIPLGFTFTFYGNNYTQCLATTNGYITFTGTAGGYSPWSIGYNCPSPNNPLNAIMAPWQDVYPNFGTTAIVRYKTIGVAPNRKFIMEFLGFGSFQCGPATCYGAQIHLYETSNVIETHIFRQEPCPGWNSGRAIHGIQNASGTIAHIVPGRNGLDPMWRINVPGYTAAPNSASSEGRRWTPTSPTAYTITTVPFSPLYMPATTPAPGQITWTSNGTSLGTGNSVTVSPIVNTTIVAAIPYSSCNATVTIRDTMRVNMAQLPLTTSGNTAVCIGDSAHLSVSTTATGTTNYSWTPAATLTNPNTNQPTAYTLATQVYTVTATNGLCSNTSSLTVTVNPLPTITFNVTDPSICPTDSVQLIASGGTMYNWFMGLDLSSTTVNNPYASPLATNQYGVEVTDANGCVDSAFNNVILYVPAVITASTSEPSICPTFSMGLTANNAVSYVWSPSTGLNYNDIQNPVATLSQTTDYTVIGTDANGCKDTTSVTVIVDPLPQVSYTADKLNGCEPVTVTFQNQSNVGYGGASGYNWTFEGHGTSTDVNPVVTYPQDGVFDVLLVATSDSGCVDSLRMTDMIHIYNIPTASFVAGPQPTTVGDPEIFFTNTSSGDVTAWSWDFAGLGSSDYSDPSFTFPYADTFLISLVVETQYGCSASTTGNIIIDDLSEIWIPSSFTPNEDGLNDTWFPVGRNLNTKNLYIEVHVFNRWGQRVFRSATSDKPWNGYDNNIGSKCPVGEYTYRVIFVNEQGKERKEMGHITLIR
jgi:gliding motility-associated-like protein